MAFSVIIVILTKQIGFFMSLLFLALQKLLHLESIFINEIGLSQSSSDFKTPVELIGVFYFLKLNTIFLIMLAFITTVKVKYVYSN